MERSLSCFNYISRFSTGIYSKEKHDRTKRPAQETKCSLHTQTMCSLERITGFRSVGDKFPISRFFFLNPQAPLDISQTNMNEISCKIVFLQNRWTCDLMWIWYFVQSPHMSDTSDVHKLCQHRFAVKLNLNIAYIQLLQQIPSWTKPNKLAIAAAEETLFHDGLQLLNWFVPSRAIRKKY